MRIESRKINYCGEVTAPPSKSFLQRAIAIAALASSSSKISGYEPSDDVNVAISVVRELGARVEIKQDKLFIYPAKCSSDFVKINCRESGLSARMFSPVAALLYREAIVSGEGTLLNRPMGMVIDALEQLGKNVSSNGGRLPIRIEGVLKGGATVIDGSESSQLLTGLLIALPILTVDSTLHVNDLKSIPYVQMTLDVLQLFNIRIRQNNFQTFYIEGRQEPAGINCKAEGDWSGAAFHLVGGAIAGEVSVEGLNPESAQADRAILNTLMQVGAKVKCENQTVSVSKNQLNSFDFDATHCPDLFPPLVVLAAACKGLSTIKGVSRLTHKESNRAVTLQEELGKMGARIKLNDDVMIIDGGGQIKGATASSRNDHRIAMAIATLSLLTNEIVEIQNPEAISKSYPGFYKDFNKLNR
ncbi:MAG: 3-phosphoshikimate 1-carboxyvinyltransferase [Flavobacteriales bacterium]